MTEPTRQIGGLARLVKANREEVAPSPAPTAPELRQTQKKPARAREPKPPKIAPAVAVSSTADVGKQNVSVSLPADLRNRSRAAFRATQHLEDDESYSDFVSKAIEAEIVRREIAHNGGARYEGGDRALASGRPMSR
jgi:hypothetical protein